MNFKTTYILFGILVVLVGVFALVLWYDPSGRDKSSQFVLSAMHSSDPAIKVADIDRVEIERREPAEKIVMQRDNDTGRWTILEPKKLRAEKAAVTNLIQQLYDATPEQNIDKAPNLGAWGLEPPKVVVTIKKGDSKAYTLNVGTSTSGGTDALIYVLDPGRPKEPMGVKKNRLDAVLKPLDDFRDTELLASAVGDLQAVELSEIKGKDTNSVAWKKDDRGHWLYTKPAGYGEAASGFNALPPGPAEVQTPKSIDTVLTGITNIKVDRTDKGFDFVADDVSDFGKYNLDPDKNRVLQIEVTRLDDVGKDENGKMKTMPATVTLLVALDRDKDDKSGKYYARLKNEKSVVKIAARNIDPLLKLVADKEALRDKALVHMENSPSAVNIKNAFGLIQLRRTAGPKLPPELAGRIPPSPDAWMLWRDDETSETVDSKTVEAPPSLLSFLREKSLIDAFVDRKENKDEQAEQEKKLGIDKDSVVVELWDEADGVKNEDAAGTPKPDDKKKKPELKSKDPTYRLTFGSLVHERDKDLVYVKREQKNKDGKYDVTLAQIPQAPLDEAKKGPLAYLDKKLPRFTEPGLTPWPGATKLTIQRGDTILEATREKDDAPWKLVQPKELAGRNADRTKVEDVLSKMNRLTPLRLADDKPKDADLQTTYGVKMPQAKIEITMTKDGKPTTYSYEIGKETKPDSGELYARQSQRPNLIFVVDKKVLDALPTDLLDPVVFTFDLDKVKKVTLTGWEDVIGSPQTLEFEKKDKTWEVNKGLAKDKFDAGRLVKLLEDLSTTRAERFVVFNSGPEAKHKLEVAKGALVIELTLEGGGEPIKLTIGGATEDGKAFYAMIGGSKDVFVLTKGSFEEMKKGPATAFIPK